MKDKATRLLELRDEFRNGPVPDGSGYSPRWYAIVLHREWAKLCGHHQAVDAVDAFMRFVEGDDA